jgi:hypothetical protein
MSRSHAAKVTGGRLMADRRRRLNFKKLRT